MTDRRTPPHHATRHHRVLAILAAAHAAGRPGIPPRELVRLGIPWTVLDKLVARGLIRLNETGACLPEYGVPDYLPPGVAPFRRPVRRVRRGSPSWPFPPEAA